MAMVSNADIMNNGLIFNPYKGIPQRPHITGVSGPIAVPSWQLIPQKTGTIASSCVYISLGV